MSDKSFEKSTLEKIIPFVIVINLFTCSLLWSYLNQIESIGFALWIDLDQLELNYEIYPSVYIADSGFKYLDIGIFLEEIQCDSTHTGTDNSHSYTQQIRTRIETPFDTVLATNINLPVVIELPHALPSQNWLPTLPCKGNIGIQ